MKREPGTSGLVRAAVLTACGAAWALAAAAQTSDPDWRAAMDLVDPAALQAHVEALAACGSRVPGYPGHDAAADYVRDTFVRLGYTNVVDESFPLTVPVEEAASLEVADTGQSFPIHALWPNLVRTAQQPPEGVTGLAVDGGSGQWPDLNGKPIAGSVVFLDFNSDARWANIAMMGARAIVFVEPAFTACRQAEAKIVSVPLNIARFWISAEDYRAFAPAGFGKSVRVRCRMPWREVRGRNLMVRVPGRGAGLRDKLLGVEAYYDSMSVVPAVAPGAEAACGMAAMLELAKVLKARPPEAGVLFLAVSGHHLFNAGATEFAFRHARRRSPYRERIREPVYVDLMLCLDLTSRNGVLGGAIEDCSGRMNNSQLLYRREFLRHMNRFGAYADTVGPALGKEAVDLFRNLVMPEGGGSWRGYLPEDICLDSAELLASATPALSLITVHDPRRAADTPLDRAAGVDVANLAVQTKFLAGALLLAAADPGLLETPKMAEDELRVFRGRLVTFDPKTSLMPNDPVVGGIGRLSAGELGVGAWTGVGVRRELLGITDGNGWFEVRTGSIAGGAPAAVEGYDLDPRTGAIVKALDRGIEGISQYPVEFTFDSFSKERTAVLFACRSMDLYDIVDPRYLVAMDKLMLFDPGNAEPFAFGYALHKQFGLDRRSEAAPYASVFLKPGMPVKIGVSSDLLGQRMLFLNSPSADTRKDAEGLGYEVGVADAVDSAPYRVLKDMFNLDEHRIRTLRRYGIENRRLERLHKAASDSLARAEEARQSLRWDDFIRCARQGLGIESRAYPDVRSTADDVVKGIVFYMALLLPFAFFCERLFFAFADLTRRIVAFVGLFFVTYLALRLVHPAFKLVETSEVILLALVILALCSIVVVISAGRFEAQMRTLKQKRGRVHYTDVSRASATATAFALGVSNMRRRKVRTFLTCTAVVLLMFTVLSFTSVKTYLRSRKLPRPNAPAYQGALVRDRTWVPMKYLSLEHLDSELGAAGTLARRSWLAPRSVSDEFTQLAIQVSSVSGEASRRIGCFGLVGFDAQEPEVSGVDRTLRAGRWFQPGEREACILPDAIAEALGIGDEAVGAARVHLLGMDPVVVGIVASDRYNEFRDLDNERLTPLDFSMLGRETLTRTTGAIADVSAIEGRATLETFVHLDARNTVLMPYETVLDAGGALQSVSVKFREGLVSEHVDRLLDRLAVTVFVGEGDRVMVYSSLAASSVGGMGNIIVPLLIAALMVLNTMSGSVHERLREIGTYSSVGLAPSHIGALFLAEACVYAILGGIGGYVIGQALTQGLMLTGGLKGLTLNYSSLASVLATLVVMATVILSTLYPARMASRMAVPDVTRKWVLPKPAGDEWVFDFPFTVSGKEVSGLYVFFRYYFASFEEQSVGRFYTARTDLSGFEEVGRQGYRLAMRVWLSPYDLGVSQDVELRAVPSGDFGIYAIQLRIRRLSGQANTWVRINRGFLDEIRKQFLLWRTLPPESKSEYMVEAEAAFA